VEREEEGKEEEEEKAEEKEEAEEEVREKTIDRKSFLFRHPFTANITGSTPLGGSFPKNRFWLSVIQDNHVSYSGIEVVIAVQVVRDVSDEFHPRNHRPTYFIVEGLPSLY
jgi:hypothetical protein